MVKPMLKRMAKIIQDFQFASKFCINIALSAVFLLFDAPKGGFWL